MAEPIEVKINVTSNIDKVGGQTKEGINEIQESANQAQKEVEKVGSATDAATKVLDKAFGGIATRVKTYYQSIRTLGSSLKATFKTGVAGANAMQKALIASGVGALVVALGLIVAYWDDILGLVNGVTSAQKEQLAAAEENVKAQETATEMLGLQENSLRLQGKSEKEIRDLKIQQTNETISALEAQLETQKQIKKSQVDAANRNKEILQGIMRFLSLPITTLLATIDMVGKALGEDFGLEEGFSGGLAKMVFDPDAIAAEADAGIEETEKALARLKGQRDGYILEDQKANAQAQEAILKAQEELNKKLLESEANYQAQLLEDRSKLDELILNQQISAQEREINAVYDKFFRLEQAYADDAETLKMITEQREKEIGEINDKYQKEADAKRKEELDKQRAFRQQIQDLAVESTLSTFSALKELNGIFDKDNEEAARRAFNREKALSLAETIVSTYVSAQKAYASQLIVGDPTSVARATLAASVAVAGGLARAATIASQKFSPTGDSTSVPSATSAPSIPSVTPQFNIVGQSGTNQLAQSIGSQFERPVRAYVVGGDVTTSQELERKRIKTATIG